VDVLLDPLQCEMLVKEASVDNTFAIDFVTGQEAERSELSPDQYNDAGYRFVERTLYWIATPTKALSLVLMNAVKSCLPLPAPYPPPLSSQRRLPSDDVADHTMNPDEDGERPGRIAWCPDIELCSHQSWPCRQF